MALAGDLALPTMTPGNVPKPLRNAPLALMEDDRAQLSFGERAALEGVLAQLWPKLAVEIGSAAGGSLARIAAYSDEVHSFDLVEPGGLIESWVMLHTGDSHTLLSAWLASLEQQVSFVLIDGDHTEEGVCADLRDVLDSPACSRTVILLHDTANAEVHAGILRAGLLSHPKIVYRDLDFIRGYEYAEGPWVGQRWGGLGLVVTGDPDTDGYGAAPDQTLYSKGRP